MYILTNYLAYSITTILVFVASWHLIWAFGIHWPFKNEEALAKAVVGTRGITKMPRKIASGGVAILLLIAAMWALLLRDLGPFSSPKFVDLLVGSAIAAVFTLRGVAGFMPAMERFTPEQPFLRLNRRFYSPLCILLGAGFFVLVAALPNWTWRLGLAGG
jgi:hypothetical protein